MHIIWTDSAIGRWFVSLGFVTLALLSELGRFCFSFDPYDPCKSHDFVGYFSLVGLPRLRLGGSSLIDEGESAELEEDESMNSDCIFRGLPLAGVFVVDGLNVLLLTPLMVWDLTALSDCILRSLPLAAIFVVDGVEVLLLMQLMVWDLSALSGDIVPKRFVTTVRSSVELSEKS